MARKNCIIISMESVDNGFILKNLTGKKGGEKPPTLVAANKAQLKHCIGNLIDALLEDVAEPNNAFTLGGSNG